ncbi:hypothetical protein [Spirillospora sp. CA-294931]|uniref:hypothetical protein n=1 Tax=Spirillospora sp. CA-294931 TaxID=3240042 RepID=UPI003D8F61F0
MLLDREEIEAELDAANKLDEGDGGPGGLAYVEAMRSIVPHAEALGDPALLFRVRLSFSWALRSKPLTNGPSDFFNEAIPVLRRCLLAWHSEPHLYPEDDVLAMWNQFFLIVDAYTWLYPEPAERLHRLLDELEKYCPSSRRWTRYAIDHYRMTVDARKGDVEAVERSWRRLRAEGPPESHFLLDGMVSYEARMWLRLDRVDRAIEALAPLTAGQITSREGREHRHCLIMPYLRAGRLDEAVQAHQGTYAASKMKLEDLAAHLEFCARTGNEERGLDVLRRNLGYFAEDVASVEAMWTAAAAALLCRRVMERDLDREWVWHCACDEVGCDCYRVWSYADLGSCLRWEAMNFADRVDGLNGTTFLSREIGELLRAGPLTGDLPLPPDTAEPRHRAAPPPAQGLGDATDDDLRERLRAAESAASLPALLQTAVALGHAETATEIRLALLDETGSRWHRRFATLVELARGPLTPEQLDRLWAAVPRTLDRVLTHPTVHMEQVRGLLRVLEPRCRPGTDDLRHLRGFGVEAEVRRGDAAAALAAYADLPSGPADDVQRRARWWIDLRHDDEAMALLPPGDVNLLVPYLRAGRLDEAREIHERTHRTAKEAPEVASNLEFCAATGELEHGRELLQRSLDLFHTARNDVECYIDRVRAYGSAIRMSERIVAEGADESWVWPADACCEPDEGWSYARLAEGCRIEGGAFIARWDELTGTDATRNLVHNPPVNSLDID